MLCELQLRLAAAAEAPERRVCAADMDVACVWLVCCARGFGDVSGAGCGPAQHVSAKARSVDIVWVSARCFGPVSADFGRSGGPLLHTGPMYKATPLRAVNEVFTV